MTKIYKLLPHIAFLAVICAIFTPSVVEIKNRWIFFSVVILIELALIIKRKSKSAHDVALLVFVFLALWEILTTKFSDVNIVMYPAPENVFAVYGEMWRKILEGIFSSMCLLFTAMFFALLFGVSLGMLVGWYERPRNLLFPVVKVLSPIPPIVYSPYVVALAPSFRAASGIIIFLSLFFPLFMNMVMTVSTIDKRILDSSQALNVKSKALFLDILLPYCVPRIINGMSVTVSISFMVLTAAEMIGATSGLGWFVKYSADFGNYTRVIAGIIMIGVVVTLLNKLIKFLEKVLVKWR